jgi:hypothetical protein
MKIIFDEYVWKARILVAFLVALPVLLIAPWISRELPFSFSPILTGAIFTGAFYALMASVVREMGVRAERHLVSSWGGYPSTTIMRWRDATRSKEWKGIQHQIVYDKLKIRLMTANEEAKDPAEADKRIADAFARIKNSIWGKPSLPTHADNIDYGFARNLYGCRWIWLALCTLSVATVVLNAVLLSKGLPLPELVLEILLAVGVILVEWGFMKSHVRHCALRYAEHAWEALASLPEGNSLS